MSFPKAALISVCALAAVVSGCAGGLGSSPAGSLPGGSAMTQPANSLDQRGCRNDGGFTVTPCSITFNSNNPGPVTVTVTQNGDGNRGGGGLRERDDCASRDIAMVVRDSRGVYTVTAGSMHGSCGADFSNGGGNGRGNGGRYNDGRGNGGNANLRIVNDL